MGKLLFFKKNRYILLLLLLVVLFFHKTVLNITDIVPSTDGLKYDYFIKYFTYSSLKEFGEIPLWGPMNFGGTTWIGSPLNQIFYPFSIFFIILPIITAFNISYMFHIFLAGISMFFLMRIFKLSNFSSFVSAVIFMFSGLLVIKTSVYSGAFGNFTTKALIPLTFLAFEMLLKKRDIIYAFFFGVVLSLSFFSAHTQLFFYNLIILGIYALVRFFFLYKETKEINYFIKISRYLAISAIILLTLSSIYLFPLLEASKYSARGKAEDFGSFNYLPITYLITLIFPNFYGSPEHFWGSFGYTILYIYVGVLTLILSFIALLNKNKKYLWPFIILAIFSILFTLKTPFFDLLYNYTPGFNFFRTRTKMLAFWTFSMAAIAGFGSEYLLKNTNTKKLKVVTKFLLLISFFSVTGILFSVFFKERILEFGKQLLISKYTIYENPYHSLEYFLPWIKIIYNEILNDIIKFSLLVTSISVLFLLKIKNKINLNYFKTALILILLADFFVLGIPMQKLEDPDKVFEKNNLIKYMEQDKSYFRLFDLSTEFYQSMTVISGIQKMDGYGVPTMDGYIKFTSNVLENPPKYSAKMGESLQIREHNINIIKNFNFIDLLNVKYIASLNKTTNDRFKLVVQETMDLRWLKLTNKTIYLYENKEVLPRAFIVRNAIIIRDEAEILEKLKDLDIKNKVILEEDFDKLTNPGEFKEAEVIYYSPNKIKVEIDLDNSGFLVLSENWFPGWKAYDNDKEVKILKADYILIAVYLDKGHHIVEFIYYPFTYKLGKIMALLTIIFLVLFFIYKRNLKVI